MMATSSKWICPVCGGIMGVLPRYDKVHIAWCTRCNRKCTDAIEGTDTDDAIAKFHETYAPQRSSAGEEE